MEGCRQFLNRVETCGVIGDEETHGYVRMPLLAEGEASCPDDKEIDEETPSPETSLSRDATGTNLVKAATKAQQDLKDLDNAPLLRPPRTVKGISVAVLWMLLGAAVGGLLAYHALWKIPNHLMGKHCQHVRPIHHMGFDAIHLSKAALSFYCHAIHRQPSLELLSVAGVAAASSVASLRLAYGRAYFTTWNDAESVTELRKLYSMRTPGSFLVLRSWRLRLSLHFIFQIVIMLWLRYMLDLGMDIQAMWIFIEHGDYEFFSFNLCGVFLGLIWTAYEFHTHISEDYSGKITRAQVFFSGLTLPLLGQHVTYLAGLSLYQGALHPFLFVSTLAEAILESSVSSMIQTYAVVFSQHLSAVSKAQLYVSIAMSFVSIGYAFSTIDQVDGGKVLAKLPGFCKSFDGRFFAVFVFRCAEITSRITSLAMFQMVTRPHGIFFLLGTDILVIAALTAFFQYRVGKAAPVNQWAFVRQNMFYVVPSVLCCLMAPMLEKDCVLTMPPWCYYATRILELVAMTAISGEYLEWDIERVQDLFSDDGVVLAAFAMSTVLMIILGVIIRWFLGIRTLIDSQNETWTQSEFNNVQHALRNRILLGSQKEASTSDIGKIKSELERNPTISSKECQEIVESNAEWTEAEWEAAFLRAKATFLMQQTTKSLEDATNGTSSMKGHATKIVKTGAPITVRSSGGGGILTCKGEDVVGQFDTALSDQKFVLETTTDPFASQELLSGSEVCLRSLAHGGLLGLVPGKQSDGAATFDLRCHADWHSPEDTKFVPVLVHEELFKNPMRFAHHVYMQDDTSLRVAKLDQPKRKGQSSKSWTSEGWQIMAINGQEATRQAVDEILQKAKKAPKAARSTSGDEKSEAGTEAGSDIAKAINPGEVAAAKGEYMVQFVKVNMGTPIKFGDKVMLKHAAGWTKSALGMSKGSTSVSETSDIVDLPRPRVVDNHLGLAFTVEDAEYGSKDDPVVYQWAADFINRLQDSLTLQESLAEKYRMLTVVAYNSRTVGVEGVPGILHADTELHSKLLTSLLKPIRHEKDIMIEYDLLEDADDDIEFTESDGRIVIQGWVDEADCRAKALGLQIGDELILLELENEDKQIVVSTSRPSEMSELFSEERDELVYLTFRSRTEPKAEDNDIIKKAVDQAGLIATLLPSWQEIVAGATAVAGKSNSDMMLEDALLQERGFFATKCGLVSSLMEAGFQLLHDDFTDAALKLHNLFDAKTEQELQKEGLFPGEKYQELRNTILVRQLEVLVGSWHRVPRIIKEDRPNILRSLFRPDVELAAMRDGLRVLYARWQAKREVVVNGETTIEMPEQLTDFFSKIQPATDEDTRGDEKSLFWLTKAFHQQSDRSKHVQQLVTEFSKFYESAETFWERRVNSAREGAEHAQVSMKAAVSGEKAKVILCSSVADLMAVKAKLDGTTLKLKEDCQVGDSVKVPAGQTLILTQGAVRDVFKTKATSKTPDRDAIYRGFERMYRPDGKDVRLLFSSDDFVVQQGEAEKAMERLRRDLEQAKTAGQAFPSVKQNLDTLNEVLHDFKMNTKDQEAMRKLALQEQEFAEMMRVANNRLHQVEAKKNKLEELNNQLEADKVVLANQKQTVEELNRKLEADKAVLAKQKRDVEDELATVMTVKDNIDAEKTQLTEKTDELAKDKEKLRIENEQLDVKKKTMEEALKEVNTYLESQKTTLERKSTQQAAPEEAEETAAKTYLAGLMNRVNASLGL
eukprot:TRINITY_DN76380_c0_g1_i1.p1 TRINITY_DN76380_c0_g1~~TRINITY_DN76380_c0_g1_i1.p1  ORF type:complete len:1719 (-),score=348.33 TRINITY_DN76380_c0_g1_i1:125-5281(-)